MRQDQEFMERRIVTGLIVSQDFIERIHPFWNPMFFESPELQMVADWCLTYFNQYRKAPDSSIQDLYMDNVKMGRVGKADAKYIEQLLGGLSDDYGRGNLFNSVYLYDKTIQYFKAKELELHNRRIQSLIDAGDVEEAEKVATTYAPSMFEQVVVGLDLSQKSALDAVERAFTSAYVPVLSYPGALGQMWNEHLIRGGFFTLLAPEKRGKSFMLMEMALRAVRQKANVAYFEAGDMTQAQVLRRICIYISQRSDKDKYCQGHFRPVGDCLLNQVDNCNRADRNCTHGIFEAPLEGVEKNLAQYLNIETLREKYRKYPKYLPCDSLSCNDRKGSIWIQEVLKTRALTAPTAKKALRKFFKRYRRRFKLINYSAGTLTVSEIRRVLDLWERQDGFVPDIIVIDYSDLLSADDGKTSDFRHRQDHVWKSLRALSQERHVLLLTATQADADSYKKGRLSLSNFSEDKRKLAHVTAQYGLNQDPQGREKKLGIMRINEIVVREGEFSPDNEVTVLQDLAIGRPFLESYSTSTASKERGE